VGPGKGGPGTHIHEFDQYYFVLEGALTIEVALERYTVGSNTLVILPAGVPHRQYNDGDVVEKHLTLLAPPPEDGRPWDRGVSFEPNGEDLVGVTTARPGRQAGS
jgi:mannose-6-phosphate isomerase-like protein (cupin superfamily)